MGGSGKGRQAGLELCSGKQIPKVAWRGWLEEWIECPACETRVRMTQLGWGAVGLSHELTNAVAYQARPAPLPTALRGHSTAPIKDLVEKQEVTSAM